LAGKSLLKHLKAGWVMRFVLLIGIAATFSGQAFGSSLPGPETVEVIGAMQGSTRTTTGWNNRTPEENDFTFDHSPSLSHLKSEIVTFSRPMPAGSILVQTKRRKLYFVLGGGQAIEYPVGVGKQGFTWSGTNHVTRKAEWPSWHPPLAMIEREAEKGKYLPEMMEGGEDNPLGARALYIGDTEYRIHGTTQPLSIGKAVSSGCIRMLNEHVVDLYDRVAMGALVTVE
jgi:lipoprotein-anchoring transpeptidase ErfK/SrfK